MGEAGSDMTADLFSPGFRLSSTDVAILILGASTASWALQRLPWLGLVILFTVGHFFLFCNVLRMARSLELIWSSCFLLLAGCTILSARPGWPLTFGASFGVTCLVGWLQARRPSYHGVAWHRINPGLPQWWERQHGSERTRP